MQIIVIVECDFEHLVHQIRVGIQFEQSLLKEFDLHIEVHARRAVEAYQTGMDRNIGILPFRSRLVLWPSEVDRVLGDEGPVVIQDDRF